MPNMKDLIDKIIPPNTYEHREGFSNDGIIEQLTQEERKEVESILIDKLLSGSKDLLIVETLAYMRSEKAVPALYGLLHKSTNSMARLMIASCLFGMNKDEELTGVAIAAFKELDKKRGPYYVYTIVPAFYYLARFRDAETTRMLESYIDHKEYLISYNAKRVLGRK